MADMFGRVDQVLRGGLSSDAMFMSWPNLAGQGLGLLIMNIGLDYRQPVRRIFELGPGVFAGTDISAAACDNLAVGPPNGACAARVQPTYYIIGRPEGRMSLSRIHGPGALTCQFYRQYGSPCSPNVARISGKAGCNAADATARRMTWQMNGVLLDNTSMRATSEEAVMQESVSAMFTGLRVEIEGDLTCGEVAELRAG